MLNQRILAAYLMGSVLGEGFRADSDVDCALLLHDQCELTDLEVLKMSGRLSAIIGRQVDLGVISSKNLIYAMQAVFGGELIFCRNEIEKDRKIMYVYSLYAKLREDRKEVELSYGCG